MGESAVSKDCTNAPTTVKGFYCKGTGNTFHLARNKGRGGQGHIFLSTLSHPLRPGFNQMPWQPSSASFWPLLPT
eukprot:12553777-Ditylum_brightwellii.AAC.1